MSERKYVYTRETHFRHILDLRFNPEKYTDRIPQNIIDQVKEELNQLEIQPEEVYEGYIKTILKEKKWLQYLEYIPTLAHLCGEHKKEFDEIEVPLEMDCSICLDPITTNNACHLQCSHFYHPNCLRLWMNSNSSCPLCRKTVIIINTTINNKPTPGFDKLMEQFKIFNRKFDQYRQGKRMNMLPFNYVLYKLIEMNGGSTRELLHSKRKVQLDAMWEQVQKYL